jgi:hypothetical protein
LYTRKKVAELTKLFEICGFHCGADEEPMFWNMMLLYRLNNVIPQSSVTVNDAVVYRIRGMKAKSCQRQEMEPILY